MTQKDFLFYERKKKKISFLCLYLRCVVFLFHFNVFLFFFFTRFSVIFITTNATKEKHEVEYIIDKSIIIILCILIMSQSLAVFPYSNIHTQTQRLMLTYILWSEQKNSRISEQYSIGMYRIFSLLSNFVYLFPSHKFIIHLIIYQLCFRSRRFYSVHFDVWFWIIPNERWYFD